MTILQAVAPFPARLQTVLDQINALVEAIKQIDTECLSGDASAKFAAMRETLAPLLSDIQDIAQGKTVNPKLLIGDLTRLREVKVEEVLKLLGEIQNKVEADQTQAQNSGDRTRANALAVVAAGLRNIAAQITNLRQNFDMVLGPWRARLKEVETWFDTVMQSFEERYSRSMKTWALVISFLLVVFLNANFFDIYRNIATSDAQRNLILQSRDEVEKLVAPPTVTSENVDLTVEQWFSATRKEIEKHADIYTGFGFKPLSYEQDIAPRLNRELWKWDGWFERRLADLKVLLGWILMALLLSVGAPFWQDTLESLFGVKNLLRKKSGTENVETQSGAGQPKLS